jgi:hypothetical protein
MLFGPEGEKGMVDYYDETEKAKLAMRAYIKGRRERARHLYRLVHEVTRREGWVRATQRRQLDPQRRLRLDEMEPHYRAAIMALIEADRAAKEKRGGI